MHRSLPVRQQIRIRYLACECIDIMSGFLGWQLEDTNRVRALLPRRAKMPSTRKELLTKVSMSLHGYRIQTAPLKRNKPTRPSDRTARTEFAGDADIG